MATETKTYNGWCNYETWCVNLWLSNEQGTYEECREIARRCKEEAPDHANSKPHKRLSGPGTLPPVWTVEQTARFTTAEAIKAYVEESMPDLGATMASDLLSAALQEVNWDDVADAFLEE